MLDPIEKTDIATVTGTVVYYSLIGIVSVFLLIVTFGWAAMLKGIISFPPNLSFLDFLADLVRFIVGALIAIFGVVLAKAVAVERLRNLTTEALHNSRTWWAYFFMLFCLSALGSMNTFFMTTQQTDVVGKEIESTQAKLQLLKGASDSAFATPEYDNKRLIVDTLFVGFESELKNPANCGFGAQASARFKELQALLPRLQPMSLGSGSCENVERQIPEYRRLVDKELEALADPNVRERIAVRERNSREIGQVLDSLQELTSSNPHLSSSGAQGALSSAWSVYSKVYAEVRSKSNDAVAKLPETISNQSVREMGNIVQTVASLLSRLNQLQTYIIFLAAIALDILLIAFFSRYLSEIVYVKSVLATERARPEQKRTVDLMERNSK